MILLAFVDAIGEVGQGALGGCRFGLIVKVAAWRIVAEGGLCLQA